MSHNLWVICQNVECVSLGWDWFMQNQSMLMRLEESVRSSSSSTFNKQLCFLNFSIENIHFRWKNEEMSLSVHWTWGFPRVNFQKKISIFGWFWKYTWNSIFWIECVKFANFRKFSNRGLFNVMIFV